MSDRIKTVLHALGYSNEYEKLFEEHELDDELVTKCIDDTEKLRFLDEIIPKVGHRIKFIEQFKKTSAVLRLENEGSSEGKPPVSPKPKTPIQNDQINLNFPSSSNSNTSKSTDVVDKPVKSGNNQSTFVTSPLRPIPSIAAVTKAFITFKSICAEKWDQDQDYLDDESLQKIYNLASEQAYRVLNHSIPCTEKEKLEASQTGLGYLIANKINKYSKKNISRKDQEEKRLENDVTILVESYQQIMKDQKLILTDEGLDKIHKNVSQKMCHEFQSKWPNSKLLLSFEKKLKNEMDQKLSKFKTKNDKKRFSFEQEAMLHLGKCKDEYLGKLKKLVNEAYDMGELKSKNYKIQAEGITSIKDHLLGYQGNPSILQQLLTDLENYMTSTFVNHQQLFEMNLEEDKIKVKTALMEITNFYNDEMEKHIKCDCIPPSKRFYLSEEIKQKAMEKPNVKLNKNQKKKLENAIGHLYLKFEERNVLKSSTDNFAIGIDLGTTFSRVGVWNRGRVTIIENEDGSKVTPSFVAFTSQGHFVGEAAKGQLLRNPQNTIFDAKRLIGRKFSDPIVQEDIKLWPFDVIPDENDQPRIKIGNDIYSPQQISAMVLEHMKNIASTYLRRDVVDAVITVPANFNDAQRQATREAGEIAGLNVLKILNESTAAAIAYNPHARNKIKRNVLIFDLGGGTLDVAVLTMNRGDIQVKCVRGDTHFGGEDFDNALVDYCISYMKKEKQVDLERDRHSSTAEKKMDCWTRLRRIRNECERRKRLLSQNNVNLIEANLEVIVIDRTDDDDGNVVHLDVPIERQCFEDINYHHFEKCLAIVKEAIKESKLSKNEIHDIVLVGGSSRIPKVEQLLSEFFDNKMLSRDVNPDEAVVYGAAVQAALLKEKPGFFCTDKSILNLTDVSTHSIGIRMTTKKMDVIIPKNSVLPFSNTKPYLTVRDDQTDVVIKIFEGENILADENRLLGKFVLSNIPKAKQGKEAVDVTMSITDDGILKVTAKCRSNQNIYNFNSPRIVRQRTLERPQRNHNLAIYFSAKAVRVGVLNENGNFKVLLKDCPDLLPYIYVSSSTRPLLLYGRSAVDLQHEDGFVNLYEILLSPQKAQRCTKQFKLNDVTFDLKIEHLLALYFHHLKRLISLAIECTSADFNPIVLVTTPYIFMSSKQILKNALKMGGLEGAKILQSTTAMAMTFFCGFDFTRTDSTVDQNQTPQEIPLILVHQTKKDIVMATGTVSKNSIEMKTLDHCFSTLVSNNDKLDTRSGLPLTVASELRSLALDKGSHVFMVTESNCPLESESVKSIFTESCSTRRIDEVDEFDGILRGPCALYSMSPGSSGCIPPYVEICPFEILNREMKGRFNFGINEYSELFSLHCPFKMTRDECRPISLNLCERWLDKDYSVVDIGTFRANTGFIFKSPPINFKIVLTDEGLIDVAAVLSNGSPVDVKAETVYMQPNEVDASSEKLGPIFEFQKTLFTKSVKGIDSGNVDCSRQPMDRARATVHLDGTFKSQGDDFKKDGARDRLRALVDQVHSKINTQVGASINRLILQKVKEHMYVSNTLVADVDSSDAELEMQYEILEKAAVRIKI